LRVLVDGAARYTISGCQHRAASAAAVFKLEVFMCTNDKFTTSTQPTTNAISNPPVCYNCYKRANALPPNKLSIRPAARPVMACIIERLQ